MSKFAKYTAITLSKRTQREMELISNLNEHVFARTGLKYKVLDTTVESLSNLARLRETATQDTKQPTAASAKITSRNKRKLLMKQLREVLDSMHMRSMHRNPSCLNTANGDVFRFFHHTLFWQTSHTPYHSPFEKEPGGANNAGFHSTRASWSGSSLRKEIRYRRQRSFRRSHRWHYSESPRLDVGRERWIERIGIWSRRRTLQWRL